jgi:hemolysin activation/secretion protein
MTQHFRMKHKVVSAILLGTFTTCINAAPLFSPVRLPSSVLPERASDNLATQPLSTPQTLPPLPVAKNQQAQNALGASATKIKFKLNKVILQGNTVYSEAVLHPLYAAKLNKVITVAELQDIVQSVTNYYRNNGYILTRAVLPPQHVAGGIVYIQIIEGYIDKVNVVGAPKGAKPLLQQYGDKIASQRPLQIKQMEHYLLLVNQVPGVQVKAVLEASKTNKGASDLNLVSETKNISGYVSYDTYGTRYIGPNEITAGIEFDSIFRSGDSTQLNITRTTRPQELKFVEGLYSMALGSEGARLIFSANQALTRPAYILRQLKIDGDAFTLYTMLQYPLVRTRTQNLTMDASANYIDSRVLTLDPGLPLYTDHLRTLRFGLNYDLSDSWYGANSASTHIEQGILVLGATSISQGTSGFTSRYGASGHFTKMELQLSRLQQFGASRYSAYFLMKGQYSLEPLLASAQFGFGGAQAALGRGYDSAEIIGDRGLAGSIEFRMNVNPDKALLQAAQLYVFYDAGVIWNAKNVVDQLKKQSATSTGVGSRFFFTKNLSGNLLWAQPLTRQVDALSIIGDGRQPRVFFSLTASA